ncbi:MAG: hypothetical protein ACOYXN_03035 [Acidobacteriota bacterium]
MDTVQQFLCTFVYPYDEDSPSYSVVSRAYTGLTFQDEEGATYPEFDVHVYQEYGFVDLHGDGRVALLCVAENGKADYLVLVEQVGGLFHQRRIGNQGEYPTLASRLYRPEGSGGNRILADEILEWPEGWAFADGLPGIPHVYEWNGQDWVLADTKHKDYYAKVVLPPLEAKLAQGPCPGEDAALQAKCRYGLEKEIAAVKAILAAP